jgi:hypothetical protein
MQTVVLRRALHKGHPRLFVLFDYDVELIILLKQIDEAKWSQTRKGFSVNSFLKTWRR